MCGFHGAATRLPQEPGEVAARNALLLHRGPDAQRQWLADDRRVALAFCRLAIIDLSADASQPMRSDDGTVHIVYNGEVYNFPELRAELERAGHVFRTRSDTEVVLAAWREWGERCVDRLLGMFAFAIHDASARMVFLARDRAGEKPLFYHHANGELRFASELKALLADPAVPRTMDRQALDYYLAFGYIPGDLCILEGVKKLPAAHTLTFRIDSGEVTARRYWSLPDPPRADMQADADALTDELQALLEDAVQRQLVADVPTGVLLSGGTDSSIIAALAARVSSAPVRTFTVTFPGHARHDEGPYARLVARHLGTRHTELTAQPASVELLPALARQFDEPMADSSMIPTYLVARLIREHATVALGGDGGDELFGGYPHHSWLIRQQQALRFVPSFARRAVRRAGAALPYGARGRNYMTALPDDRAGAVAAVNVHFDAVMRQRVLGGSRVHQGTTPEAFRRSLGEYGNTVLQAACAADFMAYLPDDLLVKVDRASMLASLEVRAPFLDHRVVEFAFGRVPDVLRATASERKILLRRLGARLLPASLDLRRKQGFSIPLAQWLQGEFGAVLRDVLHGAPHNWIDRGMVDELFRQQQRGRNNTQRIFTLAMLELWRREYAIPVPA